MTKTTVDVTAALAGVPVAVVVGGVDTHGRVHVAAALDQVGRVLGTRSFPVTVAGYAALAAWLRSKGGPLLAVGVEGTGSYGAGLARALSATGITVVEVDRSDRSARRAQGKDDDLDAITAARAALSGRASGTPKARTGPVEAIRALRVARTGAVKARTAALNQLKDLRISAPEPLRTQLAELSLAQLATKAAALRLAAATRPSPRGPRRDVAALADPTLATRRAMRRLGRRITALNTEIADTDTDLAALVASTAPSTRATGRPSGTWRPRVDGSACSSSATEFGATCCCSKGRHPSHGCRLAERDRRPAAPARRPGQHPRGTRRGNRPAGALRRDHTAAVPDPPRRPHRLLGSAEPVEQR